MFSDTVRNLHQAKFGGLMNTWRPKSERCSLFYKNLDENIASTFSSFIPRSLSHSL